MARKKKVEWNAYNIIPKNEQEIIFFLDLEGEKENQIKGKFFLSDDGNYIIDDSGSNVSFSIVNGWKPAETKPIETKPAEPEIDPVVWPLSEPETVAMISDWMKNKHGVTGTDWGTNIPKGILKVSFHPVMK
jgi:hypothetical protein